MWHHGVIRATPLSCFLVRKRMTRYGVTAMVYGRESSATVSERTKWKPVEMGTHYTAAEAVATHDRTFQLSRRNDDGSRLLDTGCKVR